MKKDHLRLADLTKHAELLLGTFAQLDVRTVEDFRRLALVDASCRVEIGYRAVFTPRGGVSSEGTPTISTYLESDDWGIVVEARMESKPGDGEGGISFLDGTRHARCEDHIPLGRNYLNIRNIPDCNLPKLRAAIADLRGYE
jgi:hypothetical protein